MIPPDFWNQRYGQRAYVYGTNPNAFFQEQIDSLAPGKLLLPAEGEGRNAVYAASLGWEVHAFDPSEKAIEKAMKLATERGVKLNYDQESFQSYSSKESEFDLIAWIYAHMHSDIRQDMHIKFLGLLKKGGRVILEAFNKEQLNYSSGGPKSLDMLYDTSEIKNDFITLEDVKAAKAYVKLKEGLGHAGLASVIRLTGKK